MSNPASVPVFDLEAFNQSALNLAFQAAIYEADGTTPTGDYYDFTGKNVLVYIDGIFLEEFVIQSDVGADANGSVIQITDIPTAMLNMHISKATLETARHSNGFWRMEVQAVGADSVVLMRGAFTVTSLSDGGPV